MGAVRGAEDVLSAWSQAGAETGTRGVEGISGTGGWKTFQAKAVGRVIGSAI